MLSCYILHPRHDITKTLCPSQTKEFQRNQGRLRNHKPRTMETGFPRELQGWDTILTEELLTSTPHEPLRDLPTPLTTLHHVRVSEEVDYSLMSRDDTRCTKRPLVPESRPKRRLDRCPSGVRTP